MWLQVLKGNVDDPGSGGEQALEKLFQLRVGMHRAARWKVKPYFSVTVEYHQGLCCESWTTAFLVR